MKFARLLFRLLLGNRLPITRGSLAVPGLHAGVTIHRDQHGIPLIEASDARDVPFAMGFCHGQDRSFQLDILQRVGRGTLSELVGIKALPVDQLSRRIGFLRSARQQLPILDADLRADLEAYARGVDAGRSKGNPHLPHEYALLGGTPSAWHAEDTLAITKLLSFKLCANWDAELVRLKVLRSDGPEALQALDSRFPAWHAAIAPVGQRAGDSSDLLARDLKAFFTWVKPGGGSNSWVVAGSRTATGRPILANDPHLDASLPAHWYLLRAGSSAGQVAGASFVGGPFVLAGHNGKAGWGITAGLVDNSDLFLEEIGPDGASVRQGDAFVACPVIEETIHIKGTGPVVERVLITPRGPIVSPVLTETTEALSLRALWLDPLPIQGLFRLHGVKTFPEFRQLARHWPLSAQNLVYADTSGVIGWQLFGQAPVRGMGHGFLPMPGWAPNADWCDQGVPFEDIPHLENPSCGYLATANNRHTPQNQGPFLGADFIDGYRAESIRRSLANDPAWDIPATMRLQMDERSLPWEEMRAIVLAADPLDADGLRARDMLRGWDGVLGEMSAPAAVYELFLADMVTRVARARAPHSWRWVIGAGLSALSRYNFGCYRRTGHLVGLLREAPEGWFAHGWPAEIGLALARAVRQLREQFGNDPARWGWGRIRPLVMHHPLGQVPGMLGRVLSTVFDLGPVPRGGDCDVINQAAALPLNPLAPTDNIASMRMVLDVGAWHRSRWVLPGGQSGNPLSPHHGDLFGAWQRGEGVPIAFTEEEIRQAAVQTLQLVAVR